MAKYHRCLFVGIFFLKLEAEFKIQRFRLRLFCQGFEEKDAYFVIFSCLTLWSIICLEASSRWISSTLMPISTISTIT